VLRATFLHEMHGGKKEYDELPDDDALGPTSVRTGGILLLILHVLRIEQPLKMTGRPFGE
jgi:hypothetical protein